MRLQEFVTVLVRDPRTQKEDSWHSYIDYEIFIHVSIKYISADSLRSYCCFCPSQGSLWGINGISLYHFWDAGGYYSPFNSWDAVEEVRQVGQRQCRRSVTTGRRTCYSIHMGTPQCLATETILSFGYQLEDCHSQGCLTVIEVCCPGIHGKTTFFSSYYLVICTSNYPEFFFLPSYLLQCGCFQCTLTFILC